MTETSAAVSTVGTAAVCVIKSEGTSNATILESNAAFADGCFGRLRVRFLIVGESGICSIRFGGSAALGEETTDSGLLRIADG